MAVYGGDVGLDEFAKHSNAKLLWETAQGRVTWGFDMAVWSTHDGEDTLFHEFARQARASCSSLSACGGEYQGEVAQVAPSSSLAASKPGEGGLAAPKSHEGGSPLTLSHPMGEGSRVRASAAPINPLIQQSINPSIPAPLQRSDAPRSDAPPSPWNLYYRVTIADAIELGLVDVINRVHGSRLSPAEFVAGCQARSGLEEVFQQTYMCNPQGAATNHLVDWSAIERCRYDYEIIRVHFENNQIVEQFGEFNPRDASRREQEIRDFINQRFLPLFQGVPLSHQMGEGSRVRASTFDSRPSFRLGFDVAASGQGDLAVIYIDERKGEELWLRGLFTCRTEDWNFIKTVLFKFLAELHYVQAAGDESGLGRQICWEARQHYGGSFLPVNFSSSPRPNKTSLPIISPYEKVIRAPVGSSANPGIISIPPATATSPGPALLPLTPTLDTKVWLRLPSFMNTVGSTASLSTHIDLNSPTQRREAVLSRLNQPN